MRSVFPVVAGTVLLSCSPMAASLTTAGADAAALKVSTPAAGGAGHQQPGGRHDSDDPDLTTDDLVAFSSRLIAAARARESRRADRLFHDPFAELLAGPDAMRSYAERAKAREEAASAPPRATDSTGSTTAAAGGALTFVGEKGRSVPKRLAIRTRFCDDFFEDCAGPRGIKQIVSVGAGMDTRGLRLKAAPGTKVFEVDQALVLRVKNALLSKAPAAEGSNGRGGGVCQAQVVAVEADLSQAGWEGELFEAGFDPNQPSAWILEGLTMYLDEQELLRLLRTISKHCSPNRLDGLTCELPASSSPVVTNKTTGLEGKRRDLQREQNGSHCRCSPALGHGADVGGQGKGNELLGVQLNHSLTDGAFCATSVSEEAVATAKARGSGIFGTWKWGCDDPQAFFEEHFPDGWVFKGVTCGTPGEYPEGADYGVGYQGKGPAYVVGYFSAALEGG